MRLLESAAYAKRGLDSTSLERLAVLGDLILGSGFNVTALSDPHEVERFHFLDSLSLLSITCLHDADTIVDVGSGAGLPALVLAIALPGRITALDSNQKKCTFIREAADALSLKNITVRCERAEDHGRGEGREAHDVVVSRALAALPVVAEYSIPLLRLGGKMVAMKGTISDQERARAETALAILGGGSLEAVNLHPFPEALNRWAYVAGKIRTTPLSFPRRTGMPAKRPLGG